MAKVNLRWNFIEVKKFFFKVDDGKANRNECNKLYSPGSDQP